MTPDPVRAIADAVLYEGYILWPYRRSALKNQRRFTFGGVYPPAHSEQHPDDPPRMRSEVLVLGDGDPVIQVTVRFLQVVNRDAARRVGERLEPVDELLVGGQRYLRWEEAVEREIQPAPAAVSRLLAEASTTPIAIGGGSATEELVGPAGQPEGALVRSWRELQGNVALQAEVCEDGCWRVRAEVQNCTAFAGGSRQSALEQTFCSTHMLLRVSGGQFVSLTDPAPELAAAAEGCENLGNWPVLVGEAGERTTMLCSPIILEDYPRIAPESPGDLFDGGEIDQLLILNILTLTDEEKAEMAASDPRAREILERTEALTPDQLMALHGTIREFGMAR